MITDNHNSACALAEDLVAYLYGEIGGAEKAKFEAHLSGCTACTEEITAFGAVRTSVFEWRERDFAPLPTPLIQLPLPEKSVPAKVETISNSRSWLTALRELFSLSPAWAGAAAACAALVICAGLFYVAVSSLRGTGGDEISGADKEQKASVASNRTLPSPTVEGNALPPPNADNDKNAAPGTLPKPQPVKTETQPPAKKTAAANISDKKAEPNKAKIQSKPVNKNMADRARTPKRNDVQLLEEDEDEDNSLRLTDLFDEISER